MNPFPAFFSYPSAVDGYMKRAKSLKSGSQITFSEVKLLLHQLNETLENAPDRWKRDRSQGTYSFYEVAQTADALRNLLMAVEVMKKTTEPGTPAILRKRARAQLLEAIFAI